MKTQADRKSDEPPRERLLLGAIDWLAVQGAESFSLRAIAQDLNTSARMLVYHFGSKEGLRAAILEEVSSRWMARVAAFDDVGFIDRFRTFWVDELSAGPVRAVHVLAFQFWSASLTTDEPVYDDFRRAVSRGWCDVLAKHFRSGGCTDDEAMARAVFAVATVEGLLLHRVSDESLPTDAAFELLIGTLKSWDMA